MSDMPDQDVDQDSSGNPESLQELLQVRTKLPIHDCCMRVQVRQQPVGYVVIFKSRENHSRCVQAAWVQTFAQVEAHQEHPYDGPGNKS